MAKAFEKEWKVPLSRRDPEMDDALTMKPSQTGGKT
jgi:hypothetical protein